MGLFSRWKRKNKIEEPQEVITHEEVTEEESYEDIGNFVLDHCEQLISTARDFEENCREYDIVTNYLTDIEIVAELDAQTKAPIIECAENILRLNASRDEYLNNQRKISDAQFQMIESIENEVPDTIRRMQSNEAYQSAVKRDMAYLEGEKLQWTKRREDLIHERALLKNIALISLGIFVFVETILIILWAGFKINTQIASVILVFFGASAGFFMLIRYQNAANGIKKAKINADHAIALLNKTKIKFVNITNAVDYSSEKYHVKNSKELEFMWNEYMEAIREKERYERASDDMEYYTLRLFNLLKPLRLYDTAIWKDRCKEITNNNEMSLTKHELLVRRQKLRSNIEYNLKVIKEERAHAKRLIKLHPDYAVEITQIVESVNKILDTKKYG